jgi:antitoxin (DNA-binding transcriptional repressor) of toxin-antitoxin stability system
MEEMAISKFKATCLSALERVRRTRKPLLVTRFGKPVAQVQPAPEDAGKRRLGTMRGTLRITGDIVRPAVPAREWKVLRR